MNRSCVPKIFIVNVRLEIDILDRGSSKIFMNRLSCTNEQEKQSIVIHSVHTINGERKVVDKDMHTILRLLWKVRKKTQSISMHTHNDWIATRIRAGQITLAAGIAITAAWAMQGSQRFGGRLQATIVARAVAVVSGIVVAWQIENTHNVGIRVVIDVEVVGLAIMSIHLPFQTGQWRQRFHFRIARLQHPRRVA